MIKLNEPKEILNILYFVKKYDFFISCSHTKHKNNAIEKLRMPLFKVLMIFMTFLCAQQKLDNARQNIKMIVTNLFNA